MNSSLHGCRRSMRQAISGCSRTGKTWIARLLPRSLTRRLMLCGARWHQMLYTTEDSSYEQADTINTDKPLAGTPAAPGKRYRVGRTSCLLGWQGGRGPAAPTGKDETVRRHSLDTFETADCTGDGGHCHHRRCSSLY